MAQDVPVTSHNTEDDAEMAAAIDAALRAEIPVDVREGASDETIVAMEADAVADEPVQVAFPKLEPVFAWPVHGLFVMELSYADFDDLGASRGGTVALGQVLGSEEHPKLVPFRGCIILFRASAGERWFLRGHWYRFLATSDDVMAIISSVDNDPRIANLQAIQQAESAREVLFNTTRSADRLAPERDWHNFP